MDFFGWQIFPCFFSLAIDDHCDDIALNQSSIAITQGMSKEKGRIYNRRRKRR